MADENEALKMQVRERQLQLEVLQLRSRFGIQRLAGSDEDIRFYTRFATYKHFLAFWKLVEPSANTKMVRITNANSASSWDSSQPTTTTPRYEEEKTDEVKQRLLSHMFQVQSRIPRHKEKKKKT
ncbi:hypothetical protein KUCAC02_004407 [Chaenocephalus aceratus]|uniref:Uncharacterized protein n=1 Tax=Chaenocephalus aceratus TaxID=36190 RepID=A0ACB9X020_CHAAC|nr:hypothetical protein KUCAC02_004407 [Chaenocephalus aceratus]